MPKTSKPKPKKFANRVTLFPVMRYDNPGQLTGQIT